MFHQDPHAQFLLVLFLLGFGQIMGTGFTQAGGGSIFIILVVGFLVAALLDGVQISCWLFDGGANKPQNG